MKIKLILSNRKKKTISNVYKIEDQHFAGYGKYTERSADEKISFYKDNKIITFSINEIMEYDYKIEDLELYKVKNDKKKLEKKLNLLMKELEFFKNMFKIDYYGDKSLSYQNRFYHNVNEINRKIKCVKCAIEGNWKYRN